MKSPTDIKILSTIYDHYYETFTHYINDEGRKTRSAKIYVPIDCDMIGRKLGVDGDIIFGRLYYYLNEKYSYEKPNNVKVQLYTAISNEDKQCIQFPLMSSILAKLKDERNRYLTSIWLSIGSLIIATISVIIAGFALAS